MTTKLRQNKDGTSRVRSQDIRFHLFCRTRHLSRDHGASQGSQGGGWQHRKHRAGSQPVHCSMLAATLGIKRHRTSANQSDRRPRHEGGVEELGQSMLASGGDQIAILIHLHDDCTGRWPAETHTEKPTAWTKSEFDPVESPARWIGWLPDWWRKSGTSRLSSADWSWDHPPGDHVLYNTEPSSFPIVYEWLWLSTHGCYNEYALKND